MESIYEYGSRAGFWRILMRLFREHAHADHRLRRRHGAGAAIPRPPPPVVEGRPRNLLSHAWRWIDYQYIDGGDRARRTCARAIESIKPGSTGEPAARLVYRPLTGPNTRRLVGGGRRLPLRRRRL